MWFRKLVVSSVLAVVLLVSSAGIAMACPNISTPCGQSISRWVISSVEQQAGVDEGVCELQTLV